MNNTRQTFPTGPSSLQLVLIFVRIGLTSFGGSVSGWFLREFVYDRCWLSEEEFMNGLALSQALPGINGANMAIWIGYRLCGFPGALAGFFGIIVPPGVVIVLLAMLFTAIAPFALTHVALNGAAAAAIGLSLFMGITAVKSVPHRVIPYTVMLGSFVAVGLFHLPLVPVVLVASAISIGIQILSAR